jgi:hypothetical protein
MNQNISVDVHSLRWGEEGVHVAGPAFKLRISVSKLAEEENFKIRAWILNTDQIRVVYSGYTAV